MSEQRSCRDVEAPHIDPAALAAKKEERLALANALHDGLTQLLTAASAYLEAYRLACERGDEDRARRLLARGMETLDASVVEVRRLIRYLREETSDVAGIEGAEPRSPGDLPNK
jgi:signal transduction histidine kinase